MNNEIRDAIIAVLNAYYKYDAPQAFTTVKRAGYNVYKNNGAWVVQDPKTYKVIYFNGTSHRRIIVGNRYLDGDRLEKVDIINYLKKPYNHAYWDAITFAGWETATQRKVRELRYAKERVENAEKELAKLAKQMEEARQRYMNTTRDLLTFRAKNGLLK